MMNDGKFSGALIKETTQIVLMDEWTPDCLNCDDAKRILQGISIDQMFSSIFHGLFERNLINQKIFRYLFIVYVT